MKPRGRLFKSLCLVVSLTILLCPTSYASLAPAIAVLSTAAIQQQPPVIRGLRFDQDNPLNLEFLFDLQGQDKIDKADSDRLIRYFLAGLTIPEDKLWVNLSPLDKDRVTPNILNSTDLGNDLVRQDYMLKQLGSALTYPETDIGQAYWSDLRSALVQQTGNPDGAIDSFSKLWIVPESAAVYEKGNTVLITEAKLKTILDQDYRLMNKMGGNQTINNAALDIARNKILPEVNKDVNNSKSFAQLRQIYYSIILAQWFKEKLRESFYKEYINKEKTGEVNTADPTVKEKMFQRYVQSFQNGVYNYVRVEKDGYQTVHRQYYSGGIQPAADLTIGKKIRIATDQEAAKITKTPLLGILAGLSFRKKGKRVDDNGAKTDTDKTKAQLAGFAAGLAMRRKRNGAGGRRLAVVTGALAVIALAAALNMGCTSPTQPQPKPPYTQTQVDSLSNFELENKLRDQYHVYSAEERIMFVQELADRKDTYDAPVIVGVLDDPSTPEDLKDACADALLAIGDYVPLLSYPEYDSLQVLAIAGLVKSHNEAPGNQYTVKYAPQLAIDPISVALSKNTLGVNAREAAQEAVEYLSNYQFLLAGCGAIYGSIPSGTSATISAAVKYFAARNDTNNLVAVKNVIAVPGVVNELAKWLIAYPGNIPLQNLLCYAAVGSPKGQTTPVMIDQGALSAPGGGYLKTLDTTHTIAYNALMNAPVLDASLIPYLSLFRPFSFPGSYGETVWRIVLVDHYAIHLLAKIGGTAARDAIISISSQTTAAFESEANSLLTGMVTDKDIPTYQAMIKAGQISYGAAVLVQLGTPAAQAALLDDYAAFQAAGNTTNCHALLKQMILFSKWQDVTRLKAFLQNESNPENQALLRQIINSSSGLSDTTTTGSLLPADSTTQAAEADYGGIALQKPGLTRAGRSFNFNLKNIVTGDFDGIGFKELSRRVILVEDLLK